MTAAAVLSFEEARQSYAEPEPVSSCTPIGTVGWIAWRPRCPMTPPASRDRFPSCAAVEIGMATASRYT